MSLTFLIFALSAILAIASGIVTISTKNPITSAISLVFHFFMLVGLYLTLQAQFVAAIQVLVYAGAIMVLVVFVIMLLNLGDESKLHEKFSLKSMVAFSFAAVMIVQFFLVFNVVKTSNSKLAPNAADMGSVQMIGKELFTNYIFPFEAISLLLLAAVVGAVVLSKRNLKPSSDVSINNIEE